MCRPQRRSVGQQRLDLRVREDRRHQAAILAHPEVKPLLSDEHFSVDGTLVKAWASMKSFQPKESSAPPDGEDPGSPPPTDTTLTTSRPAASNRDPAHAEPIPRKPQCRGRFQGRETVERDARLGHGPGRPALQEVAGCERGVVLHGVIR